MRKISSFLSITLFSVMLFSSCKKDSQALHDTSVITEATLARIKALGFGTQNAQVVPEGYLVENDIILTEQDLGQVPGSPTLRIAESEQYRTNNTVSYSSSRTIKVSGTSTPSAFSNAINAAIARYNAENLALKFTRVSTGADINITIINTGQYIASAGFPSSTGNPYGTIKYANFYTNYSSEFMTTVIAHEMGHCIGFRHTDYMDRSYSCGGGYANEGSGSVGAVRIPGTPSSADARSWMLACLSSSTDRPFNANDKTALKYLY